MPTDPTAPATDDVAGAIETLKEALDHPDGWVSVSAEKAAALLGVLADYADHDGDGELIDDLDEAEELAADLDVELAADLDGVAERRTVTYGPWEDADA